MELYESLLSDPRLIGRRWCEPKSLQNEVRFSFDYGTVPGIIGAGEYNVSWSLSQYLDLGFSQRSTSLARKQMLYFTI